MPVVENLCSRYFNFTWPYPAGDGLAGGTNMTYSLSDMMVFLTNIFTRNMLAEVVFAVSSTETVFRYRPNNTFPYFYFSIAVSSGGRVDLKKIGYTFDEASNSFLTHMALTSIYIETIYFSHGVYITCFPGFFHIGIAELGNHAWLYSCNTQFNGFGVFYLPGNDNSIPRTTTSGSSGVLSNVSIQFDGDMSFYKNGDKLFFWPIGSGRASVGTVKSVSSNSVVFTDLSSDVVVSQKCLVFPAVGVISRNTDNRNRAFFCPDVAGLISAAYTTLPRVLGSFSMSYQAGGMSDSAGRYPISPWILYSSAFSCFIKNHGLVSFFKSTTSGDVACFNDDGSALLSFTSATCTTTSFSGSFSAPDNSLVGKYLYVVNGASVSQVRKIVSNSSSSIVVDYPFYGIPTASSLFVVADNIYKVLGSSAFVDFEGYACIKEQY
jgi:hypothetical protein